MKSIIRKIQNLLAMPRRLREKTEEIGNLKAKIAQLIVKNAMLQNDLFITRTVGASRDYNELAAENKQLKEEVATLRAHLK